MIAVLTVIEEVSHSLGQHLMVVEDEAVPRVTDTFAGEQGASEEVEEDLQNKILYEASLCVLVVVGRLHFEEPMIVIV